MASLNKVLLIGNLTRDPELRYIPSGSAVCEFGLAINRRFSTNAGQEKEETCFLEIVVWGKQAESCGNYLKKGSSVFVEGRIQMDTWQDRETGKNRSKLRIVAERTQFLSPKNDSGGQQGGYQQRGYQNQNGGGNAPYQNSGNQGGWNNAPAQQPQFNQGMAQPQPQFNQDTQQQQPQPNAGNQQPPDDQEPGMPPDFGEEEYQDDIPF